MAELNVSMGGHARSEQRGDDLALARAAGRRERWAQKEMADALFDRVRATVHYLAAGDRDAEDLVQLSMMAILRSAKSYSGRGSLSSWADRITVRTSLRWLKRRRWREALVGLNARPDEAPAARPGRADVQALRSDLARALHALSPILRVVLVLRLVHGHSVAEVAAIVGVPVNTVRDRLQRGRRKLRGKLLDTPRAAELLSEREPCEI